MEIFKPIPSNKNYKVSDKGNVFNISTQKLLKQSLSGRGYKEGKGYLRVVLKDGKKYSHRKVHILVAEAFLNHVPDGTNKFVVDHIDENRQNNCLSNLRIVTNRENLSRYKNTSSKYTGVHFHITEKKWYANIWHNGKKVYLGRYGTELEAHLKYQEYLKNIST